MGKTKGSDLKKTLISSTGLVVMFVILILVNVILSYANIRWDATEDKTYSLSEGTRAVLSKLSVPVNIKFFYSRSNQRLPAHLQLYNKRVREFLSEYENFGKGNVTVQIYDPKPDSDEEEWAQKYGMRPMRLSNGERIYCGLVFLASDQEDKIEWLDPSREELLEYDITRVLNRLQSPEKLVVGIISTLPVFGGSDQIVPGQSSRRRPWLFVNELKKTYEVRELNPKGDRIDPSVDLLVIVHPKGMPLKTQYAVDQFILSGGNALVFVDPLCISDRVQRGNRFMQAGASSLGKLFGAWGIAMDSGKAVADLDHPTRVRTRNNFVEDSPVWISARGDSFSRSDVVTSRLESMLFPVAGAIKKSEGSPYGFKPLVHSGKNAALIDTFKAGFGAAAIRRDFVPARESFNLAVRVRGRFKTAFPAGPPKGKESAPHAGKTARTGHIKEARKESVVIVVADADMLADQFYVRKTRLLGFAVSKVFNDNLNFLSNACEILTGSDALIGLRTRGKFERPFSAVLELKRQAQKRWLSKEKELARQAEEANRRLRKLQQNKDTSQRLIISPEQEREIEKFKEEKRRIKRELKKVRKNLRADIESLGITLKGLNIFLMPLLVTLAGIGFAIYKQRRIRNK